MARKKIDDNRPARVPGKSPGSIEKVSEQETRERRKLMRLMISQETPPEEIAAAFVDRYRMSEDAVRRLAAEVEREDELRDQDLRAKSKIHQRRRVLALAQKASARGQFGAAVRAEELMARIDGNEHVVNPDPSGRAHMVLNAALMKVLEGLTAERAQELLHRAVERRQVVETTGVETGSKALPS